MCFQFLLGEVDMSLGQNKAGVDFGTKKISGKISFQWAITK